MSLQPRTLFAWLFIAVIVAAGIFFTYHIAIAANDTPEQINGFHKVTVQPKNALYENPVTNKEPDNDFIMHAEPLDLPQEPPKPMPIVVGQTEEDLRATRQVIETPTPIEYPDPEAKDPMETVVNSESEFGDNLRHPEQTIELQPPMGSLRAISSDEPPSMGSMGGNESVQYSPELAQNGGEFMSGIFAFDGSDGGAGYSMI
jgi:hypothetical protein